MSSIQLELIGSGGRRNNSHGFWMEINDLVMFGYVCPSYFKPRLQTVICAAHYNDVIMGAIASQITSLTIVFSTVYLGTDQRKHQSSASLAFVRGIHRSPVNSPHKWRVTRNVLPFDDVIMMLPVTLDTWFPDSQRMSLFRVTRPKRSVANISPKYKSRGNEAGQKFMEYFFRKL